METPTIDILKALAAIRQITRFIQESDPNGTGLVLKAVHEELGSHATEKSLN